MTADEEEARDRLLFHLENQTGFWFALVLGDDPRPRARFREMTEAWCKEHGRAFVLHEPRPEELVRLAMELSRGARPGIHWIRADGVTGLAESWNAGATQMFMAMNERREAYRQRFDGGILVEGRTALKRILREMAPDMFSIRSFIVELGDDPEAQRSVTPEWRSPFGLASLSSWIPEMEHALQRSERLEAFGEAEGTEGWHAAQIAAASSLLREGRRDEAENVLRQILDSLKRDTSRIMNKDVIPVFSGSAHDALGMIAAARGNHADALAQFTRARELFESCQAHHAERGAALGLQLFALDKQIADTSAAVGDPSAARAFLERCLGALRTSPDKAPPSDLLLGVLDTFRVLANLYIRQHKLEDAKKSISEGLRFAEQRAAENPNDLRWQLEVVAAREVLGRIFLGKGDPDSAVRELRAAAVIVDRLEAGEPPKGALAAISEEIYVLLSTALFDQRDLSRMALTVQERALRHLRQRYERAPEDVGLGWLLASQYLYGAKLSEVDGSRAKSDEALRRAVGLCKRLPVQDDWQASLKGVIEQLRPSGGAEHKRRHRGPRKRGAPH
jgi:tetratricopeptide (TPR) repeat protein